MEKITRGSKGFGYWTFLTAGGIGLIDSGYLAINKLTGTPVYCTPGLGNCEVVNASRWSEIFGIPIALFGFAVFALLMVLKILKNRVKFLRQYGDYLLFGFSFGGFLFSLYLTYIEIFVLHTTCQWCFLSAICMTIMSAISFSRVIKNSFNLST